VLVTRPTEQARPLSEALRERGFDVVEQPLIQTQALSDEPIEVDGYDWVVVTSPNGARELVRRATRRPDRVATIGPGTADGLGDWGTDLVAGVHTQEGLVAEFPSPPGRVLFVGAENARSHLAAELEADFVAAYRTVELEVAKLADADLVLLASPSAARAYARADGRGPAISIGPQTTAAARAVGVDVVAEAETHDVRGLVDSAAAWRASSRS
jgi:uroporphyrinogen-III synthase